MRRTLVAIALACATAAFGCNKKAPSPEHGGTSSEGRPEPVDNSALDESDETPEQPELAPPE